MQSPPKVPGAVWIPVYPDTWALIDEVDADLVQRCHWRRGGGGKNNYAMMQIQRKTVPLHRFILCPEAGMVIDHIDRNPLNNRRINLRIVTQKENLWNSCSRSRRARTSKYKGVSLCDGRWMARVGAAFKGPFDLEEDAAKAYDQWIRKLRGEFAFVNFPEPGEQSAI